MSRLDSAYLRFRGGRTCRRAFEEAARALSIPPSSLKNLRDEFDPVNSNSRRGWHQRPLRPNRQRVLDDLKDVSDDALMALVDRIIARDEEATAEAIDSMAAATRPAHGVAERLLTGRRAEEYFVAHSCRASRVICSRARRPAGGGRAGYRAADRLQQGGGPRGDAGGPDGRGRTGRPDLSAGRRKFAAGRKAW